MRKQRQCNRIRTTRSSSLFELQGNWTPSLIRERVVTDSSISASPTTPQSSPTFVFASVAHRSILSLRQLLPQQLTRKNRETSNSHPFHPLRRYDRFNRATRDGRQSSKPQAGPIPHLRLRKNVTPRYGRESVRPDGKSSIVYGNKLTPSGRVAKPHGHTITQPGKTPEYARNKAGKVIVNRK